MTQPPSPFSATYSPNIPELLQQLNCTIVLSTYQAGKICLLSAENTDDLIQLPRNFPHAMGVAFADEKLAIASRGEVVILRNAPDLGKKYAKGSANYDGFFVPLATYYTGEVNIHDLAWGNEGLWAVNTLFSCLSLINDDYSFTPKWQPHFIETLSPQDSCHLNGLAINQGKPAYVTTLGKGNGASKWRKNIAEFNGTLIDVDSNQIILDNLPFPHSPRVYDGKTYLLLSATGELVEADIEKGSYAVLNRVSGFARGMSKLGDYLFIGLSKIRKKSSTFKELPIADKSIFSGVMVIHLPTAAIVGHIKYETSVDEIYDVQVLPNLQRPGILNHQTDDFRKALITPTDTYWATDKSDSSQTRQ